MRVPRRALVGLLAALALACVTATAATAGCAARLSPPLENPSTSLLEEGMASWYGKEQQGGPTASGERFDMNQLTAAHKHLKMGTRVRVERVDDGRSVVVRINDRGPYARARIIDVSFAAARALGMLERGVVRVRLFVVR